MQEIGNLSNHIIANNASKMLGKMKSDFSRKFKDISFYRRCISFIGQYKYRNSVLKFIHTLFDDCDLGNDVGQLNHKSDSDFMVEKPLPSLLKTKAKPKESFHGPKTIVPTVERKIIGFKT